MVRAHTALRKSSHRGEIR